VREHSLGLEAGIVVEDAKLATAFETHRSQLHLSQEEDRACPRMIVDIGLVQAALSAPSAAAAHMALCPVVWAAAYSEAVVYGVVRRCHSGTAHSAQSQTHPAKVSDRSH